MNITDVAILLTLLYSICVHLYHDRRHKKFYRHYSETMVDVQLRKAERETIEIMDEDIAEVKEVLLGHLEDHASFDSLSDEKVGSVVAGLKKKDMH